MQYIWDHPHSHREKLLLDSDKCYWMETAGPVMKGHSHLLLGVYIGYRYF